MTYGLGAQCVSEQFYAELSSCIDTRQSTVETLLYYAGNLVDFPSRRIKTVITITCEAEYIAASVTTQHATWLNQLLEKILGYSIPPVLLDATITHHYPSRKRTRKHNIQVHRY